MADNDATAILRAAANPAAASAINIAQQRGNNLATSNAILQDRATLSPLDFQNKYGSQITDAANAVDLNRASTQNLQAAGQQTEGLLPDSVIGVGTGALNSFGGALTLGARLLGPDAARTVGDTITQDINFINRGQSPALKAAQAVDATTTELDKQDNTNQYEKDVQKDGSFIADMKSFGRDATAQAVRMYEQPRIVQEGLAEGVGSIVAAAPTGGLIGGLRKVGSSVIKGSAAAEAGNTALAIGAMEGGGAYTGASQQVQGMTHNQLMTGSDQYRTLIAAGVSQADAKNIIADRAGLSAAVVQAPLAVATGKLVEHFEGAPFAPKTIRIALQDMGKEGIEEATQNVTGQAAQNLAIQQNADATQRIGEGLGSSAVQGAVYGIGGAGVVQAPSIILNGAASTLDIGKSAVNAVRDRGQRINETVDASASNSEQSVAPAMQAATEQAPAVAQAIKNLASQEDTTGSSSAPITDYITKVTDAVKLTNQDIMNMPRQHIEQMVNDNGGERPDLMTAMVSMARMAKDENQSSEDRAQAALFVAEKLNQNDQLFNQDIPSFLQNVDHNNENYQTFDNFSKILKALPTIPTIKQALNEVQNPNLLTEKSAPETVALQAVHAPQAVNPDIAEKILYQASQGGNALSDTDINAIKASVALTRSAQSYDEQMGEAPVKGERYSDIVSRQINTDGGRQPWQRSMEGHVRAITEAARAGNMPAQEQAMTALNMFAQGLNNKITALNTSVISGQKETYESAGPDNKWLPKVMQYKVRLHPTNENSVDFAKQVEAEARAVTQLANNMAEIYPQFDFKPIEPVSLSLGSNEKAPQEASKAQPVEASVEEQKAVSEAPKSAEKVQDNAEPEAKANTASETVRNETERSVERASSSEQTVSETVDQSMAEEEPDTRFDKLADANEGTGKNQFLKAFTVTKNSRITALMNPINEVREMLGTPKVLAEFMGLKSSELPDNVRLEALDDLLSIGSDVVREMNKRLSGKHEDEKVNKQANTLKAKFNAGEPVNRWMTGRIFNIFDRVGKDGFRYNKPLMQTAVMAGLVQALNADKQKPMTDMDTIAEIVGISQDKVTDELFNGLSRGVSVADFKRSLADKITEYWGIRPNSKTSLSLTKGIPEAVAIEVIHGLVAAGLIELGIVEYHDDTVDFTQNRVYFDGRDKATTDLIRSLGSATSLLDKIAVVEPVAVLGAHVGKPSTIAPKTQLRSPMVANTRQQQEALLNESQTPYLPNMNMFRLVDAFGIDNFIRFMGGQRYEPDSLNVNHERSLEGKNRTLEYSFNNVMAHMVEVEDAAKVAGVDVSEMPTFYDFNMSKVGRMQMQGSNNPQSDKLAREIFMPTKSVLNMKDEAQANMFWMTVAQGLGIKTEKVSRADAVNQAQELTLNGKYREAIDQLVEWLGGKDFPSDLAERITSAMGSDASMHGLHGLLSVANYLYAVENDQDLTKFEHFNYLEADGKTNGPIMTTALFASRMNGDIIRVLRKGGIFLGEEGRSLNSHIQERDGLDLYQSTTDATSRFQDDFREAYSDNEKVMDRLNTMQRVMAALDANIELADDGVTLKLKRGVTKNPLTISIYGSGIDGIAAKVANGLMESVYEMLSNGNVEEQTYQGFDADLTALISEVISLNPKDGSISFKEATKKKNERSEAGSLTPSQFAALKSHVRVLFVNQMHKGIHDQILQHVNPSTSALQKATNLQSVFLTGAFRQAIVDKMLEVRKREDYHAGDFLSDADLKQIYKDLRPLSPIINTGTQNFFIAGSQKAEIMPTVEVDGQKISMPSAYARGIDDSLSSAPYVFQPDVAGVKGVPSLVIGTGDGMIMQNVSVIKDSPKGTLKVFDGINLPASDIDESSRKVNQSVYKAMTANPMKAVAESFNTFLANDPVEQLLGSNAIKEIKDFVILEVSKAVSGSFNPKELLSVDEVRQELNSLGSELNTLAMELDARNIVLNELSMSVDQMASAESPYSKEGTLRASLDADEMADIFNERFEQVLADLKEGKKNEPPIERNDNGMLDSLEDTTTPDQSGARIATIPSLNIWLNTRAKDMNQDQKDLMGAALTSLKDSGYRVLFGSRDQLNEYEGNNYPEYYSYNGYLGKIIPEIRHMFISNVTGETLLHELVHAATLDKVLAYYNNPTSLEEADRGAVERIEGLMGEWLIQSTEADSEALNTARQAATSQVAGYIQTGNKALAVNEFMAWVLSNQELMKGAKKTAVRNPVFRVIGDALKSLKALIWGKRGPSVNEDLLSNLRFNTRILMKTPTPTEVLRQDMRKVAMFQNPSFGTDARLTGIRARFAAKISEYITDVMDPIGKTGRTLDLVAADLAAEDTLDGYVSGIFGMNRQQHSTFAAIHTAMALATKLDSTALSRVQDYYDHVLDNLKVEDLMRDPSSQNPNDRWQAQQKFDVITGAYAAKFDKLGRSDRLSTFLALAQTSQQFRDYLYKLAPPKAAKNDEGTLDAVLENLGDKAMDALQRAVSGDLGSPNVQQALDKLSLKMSVLSEDDMTWMEQYSVKGMDKMDNFIKDNLEKLSDKAHGVLTDAINNTSNRTMGLALRMARIGTDLLSETNAELVTQGITSALNQGDDLLTLREVVNEVVGRTKENASIFDMISEVRAAIQQTRQQFRDGLPEIFSKKFSRPLTEVEKGDLFYGLGKTDAASLYSMFGVQGTLDLIQDDIARKAEIDNLEKIIDDSMIFRKAQQLAHYMLTGEHGSNLLRNAQAIAMKLGERGQNLKPSQDLIDNIDALVSLYAINNLPKNSLQDMIQNEKEGMNYIMSYMVGTRKDEQANIISVMSAVNNYKGHIPSTSQTGVSLIVAGVDKEAELYKQGYQFLGSYEGSSADRTRTKMAYYYQPVSGRATYNQGVLQTVHQTVNGIQPNTGYTLEGVAGRVTDPTDVRNISSLVRNQRDTAENVLPVYDGQGNVVAYERAMDPKMMTMLNKSTDLFSMVGVWKGRQIEEKLAQIYNEKLLDNLDEIWKQGKKDNRENEFIDLSKSTDPVHMDTWKLIPNDVRNAIKAKFGRAGFPLRRDMINDAVGFRSASIGDMWTGDTRHSDSTRKFVADVATGIFGKDAYSKLVRFEKLTQKVVTEAKLLIVVKSVIVPIANSVANVYQLMARGMPLRKIANAYAQKTSEINDYARRAQEKVRLDADLASAVGRNDNVAIRKISNRIQAIEDSYKRMSIWPLIEAGEFSAITEGGVSNDDLRISNFIDKMVDYIPDGMKIPYRYAMITKDTPVFKAMAIATQYGDFVAKAAMYDHLRAKEGLSKEEALAQISEEFVNYNRLAGRVRNYTESTGFIWFWNFKLRSLKVATSLMRHNPARALLMTFMPPSLPVVGNVGTPVSDNVLGSLLDGRLGNSIGWSIGLRAPTLNPWVSLLR